MPFVLFTTRIYLVFFLLLLGGLFVTFIHRAEYYDEAWFAEQSYWLIQTGRVKSELFRGYNGWEKGIYVFHKLFIYAGALVMSVTGVSVAANKLVSILFGLLGGYLVWVYGRSASKEQQWLSVVLYLGCGTLIRFISVNRPETMCMAIGFASYLALDPPKGWQPKPIWAGILAGLAALTHLNGIIYLMAGALWLWQKMGWRSMLAFSVVGALTLSLYGLDALLAGQVGTLIEQFRNDPATQENLGLMAKLAVMADYHQIFFHSQNEAALSVWVLLCALLFRKQIGRTEPLLLYTLLLIGSFWLLTKSSTDIYFLLFLPWLSLLVARWLVTYLPDQPVWQKRLMQGLMLVYLVVSTIQFREVIIENRTVPDTERHNALLAEHMPHKHTTVIAPLEFFFGQMETYQIWGLTYYLFLAQKRHGMPLNEFFQRAEQEQVEYIISDHRLNASYEIPINAPATIGAYQRVFQDEWNTIYARR
ncbi:ArnT family glycosyltransferase [Spirosoma gilvum]